MTIQHHAYPYIDSAALFSQVAAEEWAVFLDSGVVEQKPLVSKSKHADFDVLAIKPRVKIVCHGSVTTIEQNNQTSTSKADPLLIVQQELAEPSQDTLSLHFQPGAIGYFSYDLARRFEKIPSRTVDDEGLPEMAVGIYDVVVVVDHRNRTTQIMWRDDKEGAAEAVKQWQTLIEKLVERPSDKSGPSETSQSSRLVTHFIEENMSREHYQRCFDQVRNYTIEGDCYQVNLAKRFSAQVVGDSWQTYASLRIASPAPYGAYFNFPFAQVLSNSPESFIQCRQRAVTTSPIKGTMPRDHSNAVNDKRIADQLQRSIKDRSENLMIVDLMRNDLSRCCEHGSVKVPKLFALHSFANVHHLISTITGKLKQGLHSLDLLRNCFPGGSITGAPKIRAMQIIEELEPHRRGLYCGSIGYVGMDGSLETNIAIRTMVVKDGVARFSAGGGLVIDSNADAEYQEIIDKARMMTEALGSRNAS